jgi:hypothetical protein
MTLAEYNAIVDEYFASDSVSCREKLVELVEKAAMKVIFDMKDRLSCMGVAWHPEINGNASLKMMYNAKTLTPMMRKDMMSLYDPELNVRIDILAGWLDEAERKKVVRRLTLGDLESVERKIKITTHNVECLQSDLERLEIRAKTIKEKLKDYEDAK